MADETTSVTDTTQTAEGTEAQTALESLETEEQGAEGTEQATETQKTEGEGTEGAEGEGEGEDKVPDKYEIKAPEGMELDAQMVEQFTPIFKELGLSQEKAQKLADAYSELTKARDSEQTKKVNDFYKEKAAEVHKLPPETRSFAKKALAFAKEAGIDVQKDIYMGNNASLAKCLAVFGKLISEHQFHEGDETHKKGGGKWEDGTPKLHSI